MSVYKAPDMLLLQEKCTRRCLYFRTVAFSVEVLYVASVHATSMLQHLYTNLVRQSFHGSFFFACIFINANLCAYFSCCCILQRTHQYRELLVEIDKSPLNRTVLELQLRYVKILKRFNLVYVSDDWKLLTSHQKTFDNVQIFEPLNRSTAPKRTDLSDYHLSQLNNRNLLSSF